MSEMRSTETVETSQQWRIQTSSKEKAIGRPHYAVAYQNTLGTTINEWWYQMNLACLLREFTALD